MQGRTPRNDQDVGSDECVNCS